MSNESIKASRPAQSRGLARLFVKGAYSVLTLKPLRVFLRNARHRRLYALKRDEPFCNSDNVFLVNTYKHAWFASPTSGNAYTAYKGRHLLTYLPFRVLKNREYITYDYFVSEDHIKWSVEEANRFLSTLIDPLNIDLNGKRVLDISGGNGHVADVIRSRGADVVLTEINEKSIEYAKNELDLEAVKFEFQSDRITDIVDGKFDVILLRAAIMFCLDVETLVSDLTKILSDEGVIIVQHAVEPTLGTMLRTQVDTYNYLALYQPDHLVRVFEETGFKVILNTRESDPDPYVYDHDHSPILTALRIFYELSAIRTIPRHTRFPFQARDRKRSHLVFLRASG